MSETEWTEEAPPRKKKRVPVWVWFCSGGCLLALIALTVVGYLGFAMVKKGRDPEVQWPALAKRLPFDERPDDWQLLLGMNMKVMEQYQFLDEDDNLSINFQYMPGGQGRKERDKIFAGDAPNLQSLGMLKAENVEKGTIDIQGRELPIVRLTLELGGVLKKLDDDEDAMGPTVFLDLTRDDEQAGFWVQVIRSGADDPITDDKLRELFAPFHVGPNR